MRHFFMPFLLLAISGCDSNFKVKQPVTSPILLSHGKSDTEEVLDIIDAHVHTDFSNAIEPNTKIMDSEVEFLRETREANIVGAVSLMSPTKTGYQESLKSKNVIFCFGLAEKNDYVALEADLKAGKYGCLKIYLGYVYKYASDSAYQPAYRLAQKYKLPVIFHTGDTYSPAGLLKYADPLTIDEVAVQHPDVKFVIAHLGNPWIASAAEVAYKNPNVYVDGSALMIGNMGRESPANVDEYVVKPLSWAFHYMEDPSKLMYGSDWPLNDMKAYVDAFKKAIPRQHWRAVFHDNAVKVFGLKNK